MEACGGPRSSPPAAAKVRGAPPPRRWENTACWISWDGFEWHTCKNFRFVPKEHELDGLSDEEGFDEEAELEAYYVEQQRQQEDEARC